ncbi:MAG TPA: DUF2489 domain-containing protein [Marinagarivorans sp.]
MFENTITTLLFFAGLFVVLALAAVAGFLHWQLHLRKKRDAQLLAKQEARIAKHRQDAINSLRIIGRSYLAEQVELGEAGIRVSNLMDYLALSEAQRAPFRVFDEVNAKIKHIPILQAWKDLPSKERRQHLKVIQQTEVQYKDFAMDAAKALANFDLVEAQFYAA